MILKNNLNVSLNDRIKMIYSFVFISLNMDTEIKGVNKIIFEYCYFPRSFEKELIKDTALIRYHSFDKSSYRNDSFMSNNYGVTNAIQRYSDGWRCWTIRTYYNVNVFRAHFKCEFK